jgi:hypothetical protein
MDKFIVGIIVTGVLIWACRAIYRTFTSKEPGCNCSNSCKKKDSCDNISQDTNENLNLKN